MNYLDLINYFWKCDEVWEFTATETRLYMYLLKVANALSWQQNPLWHSDAKMSVGARCSTNSMKTARNRLVQAGLVVVESGGKGYANKSRYQILTPKHVPNLIPNHEPKQVPNPTPINRLNKTKLNNNLIEVKPIATVVATPPQKVVDIEIRKKDFFDDCAIYLEKYGKDMIREFYDYWTEPNKSGKMMRFEDQKFFDINRRLVKWAGKSFNKSNYETTGKDRRSVAPAGSHLQESL